MARYVDVDKAYEIARTYHKDFARSMADLTSLREVLEDALEDTPTADVVEVVRCGDCERFCAYTDDDKADENDVEGADGVCFIRIVNSYDKQFCAVKKSEYCSYGTKKDLKV